MISTAARQAKAISAHPGIVTHACPDRSVTYRGHGCQRGAVQLGLVLGIRDYGWAVMPVPDDVRVQPDPGGLVKEMTILAHDLTSVAAFKLLA